MPPILPKQGSTPLSPHFYLDYISTISPADRVWSHDNIRPIIRFFITDPWTFQPSGYPAQTGSLPSLSSYPLSDPSLSGMAEAAAEVTFRHMVMQGAVSGKGRYHNGSYDCGILIQNIGSFTGGGRDVAVLVGHPYDQINNTTFPVRNVSGLGPAFGIRYAFGGITGTANMYNYCNSSGIAETKKYIQYYGGSLKNKLDSSGMCYPKFGFMDLEDYIDPRIIFNVSGGIQVGNYRNIQLDPRYSTETIFNDPNGTGFLSVTFSGWWNSKVVPKLNISSDIFATANSGACNEILSASVRNIDYCLNEAVYKPLKEYFPNMLFSNYGVSQVSSGNIYLDYFNLSWAGSTTPYINADYSSNHLYPYDNSAGYASLYLNQNENIEDFDFRTHQTHLDMAASGGKTIIPWVSNEGVTGLGNLGTSGHLLEIWNKCYNKNIDTYIVFNPNISTTPTINFIEKYMAFIKLRVSGYQGLY